METSPPVEDTPEAIAADVARIGRISAVPSLLRIICANTGMRFAAVARVTDGTWTACAVEDNIDFGLPPGGQLDVHTTMCKEARAARLPVAFDHASENPVYRDHHTPRIYNIESYISVPIVLPGGEYFGNLCAIDPEPHEVANARTVQLFENFAELIGHQLELEAQQEHTEAALLDARATAELRDQFIAVLGHDLRNPLASVSAISEILARRSDQDVARYGDRLRTTARRMAVLIEDVLDFARGRMGAGMRVHKETVADLQPTLSQVVAELRDAHPQQPLQEHYQVSGPVECDTARVQQLLSNLLGNALSYGARDEPVRLDARLDSLWLTLSVTNTGVPITPDHLAKIFEPFWRPATSAPGGGLGLGLHICSQIVHAHGGTLQVSSTAESGTCFTARLPARQGATATA